MALDGSGNQVEVTLKNSEPVAQVFKIMNEEQFGELWIFRIYSGVVKTGTDLLNSARSITERGGQIYFLNGPNRSAVNDHGAGATGEPGSLKNTNTGHPLRAPHRQPQLPAPAYPTP